MKGVKRNKIGEYVQKDMIKKVMQYLVFGNVFDWWHQLNPEHLPTILWAPGKAESRWFVEQFQARGVRAAHVDGDTSDRERERIFSASDGGDCPIVSSCGVLREGVDMPWLRHGILVQACGLLKTFLQLVGRLLRSCDGKQDCVLQDQAGAWHNHGNPNRDFPWAIGDTDKIISQRSRLEHKDPVKPEPLCCPKCHAIRFSGRVCTNCGHEHKMSVRAVRMESGSLHQKRAMSTRRSGPARTPRSGWAACLLRPGQEDPQPGPGRLLPPGSSSAAVERVPAAGGGLVGLDGVCWRSLPVSHEEPIQNVRCARGAHLEANRDS